MVQCSWVGHRDGEVLASGWAILCHIQRCAGVTLGTRPVFSKNTLVL